MQGGSVAFKRRPSVRESVAVREGKDSIFLQLWWTRGEAKNVKRSDEKLTGSGDGKKRGKTIQLIGRSESDTNRNVY
jgi:hypothetical protein